jgi:tetratricopeptide (TPR) repeat protein
MQDRLNQLFEFKNESPEDPFIHYAIASEYLKQNKWQEALDGFMELTQKFPDYLGTYYHLGKLHQSLGQIDQAKDTFETGIKVAQKLGNSHALGELKGALNWLIMENDED